MGFQGNTMTTPSTLIVLPDPTPSDYVESTTCDSVNSTPLTPSDNVNSTPSDYVESTTSFISVVSNVFRG
jgi:hypothetical protein